MPNRILLSALGALIVSGCATAEPPTITAQEALNEELAFAATEALSATDPGAMPTSGTASYTGTAQGTFTPDSAVDGFIADFAMTADFGGNTIDGTVSNMNSIENGNPDQLVGGTLDIDGSISGNAVSGMASGVITAVEDGFRGSADANFAFDGTFRNDTGVADAVSGTVTGRADGDFSVVIQEGTFYGTK